MMTLAQVVNRIREVRPVFRGGRYDPDFLLPEAACEAMLKAACSTEAALLRAENAKLRRQLKLEPVEPPIADLTAWRVPVSKLRVEIEAIVVAHLRGDVSPAAFREALDAKLKEIILEAERAAILEITNARADREFVDAFLFVAKRVNSGTSCLLETT